MSGYYTIFPPENQAESAKTPQLLNSQIAKANFSLLVAASRAVDATAPIGRGAAPNALVRSRSVSMTPVWRIDATLAVTRTAAPLAMLFVVAMLMRPLGAVYATPPITRTTAISTLSAHSIPPSGSSRFRLMLYHIFRQFQAECVKNCIYPVNRHKRNLVQIILAFYHKI